jgi:pyrroloquinoline-quinone synthase
VSVPLPPGGLEATLRRIGSERYHDLHPFYRALHDGRLARSQVQAWALDRYYYQSRIPAKDATLLARLPTSDLRREWRSRLIDHDGDTPGTGGIARWLKLTDGLGLDREFVVSLDGLLPAPRFAVDAYVAFVPERSVLEAVASSLTELFSPKIISERVSGMLRHYSFVSPETLAYFTPHLTQAPRDPDFALAYVRAHASTVEQQDAVIAALCFKCALLWSMLDALDYCCVSPGHIPPGAFRPT